MRKGNESDVFAMIENAWRSTVIPFEQAMFEQDLRQTIKDLHALHVPVCRLVGNRGMPDGTSEMCMEVSEHLQNAMRVLQEIKSVSLGEMASPPISSLSQGDAEPSQPVAQPCESSLSVQPVRGAHIYNLECRGCGEVFDERHADRRTPEFEPAYIVCPECGCDELGDPA